MNKRTTTPTGADSGNKEVAKKKRPAPPHAFKPGQSGNPAGRAKRTPEELDLVAACKAKAPDALAVIERIMVSGENERNQLAAATAIIERGFGKAVQPQTLSAPDGGPISHSLEVSFASPVPRGT